VPTARASGPLASSLAVRSRKTTATITAEKPTPAPRHSGGRGQDVGCLSATDALARVARLVWARKSRFDAIQYQCQALLEAVGRSSQGGEPTQRRILIA
jgi:hypothetical protein